MRHSMMAQHTSSNALLDGGQAGYVQARVAANASSVAGMPLI